MSRIEVGREIRRTERTMLTEVVERILSRLVLLT